MDRIVIVDIDVCIGCEACVEACPDVFSMGPGSLAQVYNPDGSDELMIEEVMELCPVNCILWEN